MNNRIKKVVEGMQNNHMSQMLITSTTNIFYLTGRWINPGERLLALYINDHGDIKLILNELFKINSDIEGIDIITYIDGEKSTHIISNIINYKEILGIDKDWPAHFLIELMHENIGIELVDSSFIVDKVRMIKEDYEINLLRKSSQIADLVMQKVQDSIDKILTEKQLSKIISETFEKNEVNKLSFETIVGYGKNGADPHHSVDNTVLHNSDSIVVDMGGILNYYCSDITRTFFYGEPCNEAKIIYRTVLEANLKAIDIIKPGVLFSQIDNAARSVISAAGFGGFFTHRTGHNIGIEDHEFPSVSSENDMIILPGMVFSIEPGIYIPGKYGVRIEDLVVVTESGVEVLNKYPKQMTII